MKKPLLLMAALLGLGMAWTGCNKAGKLNEKSEFIPPTGPMEFKLKWPQGERIEQDMDLKTTSETSIPGQAAPMKQDVGVGQAYGLTVLQANPDGTHEIEMDFLSARMSMKSGEKVMVDYDSAKPGKSATPGKPDPFGDVFGKVVGTKIQYYLNATNGVDRVEGVDAMLDRLSAGPSGQQQMAPMKSMFNDGYFKQMMSANLLLPPKPVQPGDTWPVEMEFPMGQLGTMVLKYDFTFARWEMHGKRNCARLEFQGTIETKQDATGQKAPFSMTLQDGTTSGISWFDPELGITIDTTMNQNFSMIIQVPLGSRKKNANTPPKMQSITNVMSQAMTLKLVSVK